ncbi:MAG: 30S ribosomal protein S18 [Bacteroidetes bacterium]|nr:30S ribosomal protein S18 [Bacteroidota bacterium]
MAKPNTHNNSNSIYPFSQTDANAGKKKYCRFKKSGIKYIDYKDGEYLKKFLNEQGKILPRRLTGTSLKFQRKVAQAIKRGRHIGVLPFIADNFKSDN